MNLTYLLAQAGATQRIDGGAAVSDDITAGSVALERLTNHIEHPLTHQNLLKHTIITDPFPPRLVNRLKLGLKLTILFSRFIGRFFFQLID